MTVSQALQLAQQHHQAGRLSEAEALFRQILSIAPRHAPALHHLGLIAFQVGKFAPAIECLQAVVALEPTNAAAYSNLGEALRCASRLEEAAACFHHALALKPDLPEAHLNLGNALGDSGHLEESIASYQRALAIAPTHARAWCALGAALERQADFAGAERGYRQAIAHSPGLAEAHINLGALLLRWAPGEEGWREYEWRRRFTTPSGRLRALPRKSEWQGEPMPGGTLLIHTEQGLGDSLQFLRYLPLARERAGAAQVILAGQPQLVPLLQQIECGMADRVVAVAEDGEVPPFDRYLPLLSLPRVLGRFAPLPALEPYLKAEEALRTEWRTRFDPRKARRVGLAWKGNPAHGNDRRRSLPPEKLIPLLRRPEIEYVSLQFDPGTPLPATLSQAGMRDFSAHVADFADSAALFAELDLIITVDTAAAHLAGALGRPVWLLLPHLPDWRWGIETEQTPWYPTMRLFRQTTPDAWGPVVERAARALEEHRFEPV